MSKAVYIELVACTSEGGRWGGGGRLHLSGNLIFKHCCDFLVYALIDMNVILIVVFINNICDCMQSAHSL